jgi:hypothetical protein
MFENLSRPQEASSGLNIGMSDEEIRQHYNDTKHWLITDTLHYSNGTTETVEHINVVVDSCSKLLACLLKGEAGQTAGNIYWAVGKGLTTWENTNLPSATTGTTKLVNEIFRKKVTPSDIVFLDNSNAVTATITNKLQIKVTFLEAEANDEWREFGLFGGNASATKDSGLMLNYKIHPLIFKTNVMRVDRTIRITL